MLRILSHLVHPYPSIEPLALENPLLGVALIVPWGDFDTSAPSFTANKYRDSVNAAVLRRWSSYCMGEASTDEYNQPFRATEAWWQHLRDKSGGLLITAGSDEVAVDGIQAFAKVTKVSQSS